MSIFIIKLIGLIAMLFDHIAAFLPGIPIEFHWIGRISAPLFCFAAAEGFSHTGNKKKYVTRLYIASVVMSVVQTYFVIDNNFFRTITISCILFFLADLKRNGDKQFAKYALSFIIWQIITCLLCVAFIHIDAIPDEFATYNLPAITGSMFCLEGGIILPAVSLAFYLTRGNKTRLSAGFFALSLLAFLLDSTTIMPKFIHLLEQLSVGFAWGVEYIFMNVFGIYPIFAGGSIFLNNYQWMMIFALPFILTYNGKRGLKIKTMFYIAYPFHIILLILIAFYLNAC